MSSTIDTAARQAEIQRLWEEEQLQHPLLRGPEDVPGSCEALTTEWLTAVLCAEPDGAEVVSFELGPQYVGTTSGRSVAITYNEVGQDAGLPTHLFAKFSPSVQSRCLVGINGSSAGEVAFYNEIEPTITIVTPESVFAAFDEPSCRTFLLLEDVSATRGAKFGTGLDLTLTREMAESMVTQMANLHGGFWNRRREPDFNYRDALAYQEDFNNTLNFEALVNAGFEIAADVIPAEVQARKAEWHATLMRSLEINVAATPTLIHQDTHIANWYALPDGTMGLTDWQCIAWGQWALDVAYALSIGLRTDDRRVWERDLIELYLDGLGTAGGEAPSFDEAWLAYRQQMFHAGSFWISTTGIGEHSPVAPEICRLNVQRTTQAVVDLDSFGAVGF
jgi:hypothetical protein